MNPPPSKDKLTVTWDDVQSPEVDARLKQQASAARSDALISPALNMSAGQIKSQQSRKGSIWYNAAFAMAAFGLLGGLLAWGALELVQMKSVSRADYKQKLAAAHESAQGWEKDQELHRADLEAWDEYDKQLKAGTLTKPAPKRSRAQIELLHQNRMAGWDEIAQRDDNPYFNILRREDLSRERKEAMISEQNAAYDTRALIANILAFGLTGMLIAASLSVAEPIIDRNFHGALVTGAVGAMLGLFGGVIVSFLVEPIGKALGSSADASALSGGQLVGNAIKYGVIGLFLSLAPGVVLRNLKKSSVGVAGGLIGGLVGGVLFSLVDGLASSKTGARAAAYLSIGGLTGLATGLIENAAKTGWLKVLQGLIAGKQFILYRATTFIGGAPDCHIYLFKDPQVGRRHAAIHIVPGGFDLENLPLGTATYVNGKPVTRQRLRTGDQIQVGGTVFSFQEKEKAAG